MSLLKIFDIADIGSLLSGNYQEVLLKYLLPVVIPVLIIALINCFLGHKMFKILVGIGGLAIGALIGIGMVSGIYAFQSKPLPNFGIMAIAGIIGASIIGFFSYKLYKGGAFCMGFVTGMILGILIMKVMNKDEYLIAGVIGGLLMGLLAVDMYNHLIILLTSMNGAIVSAACISLLLKNEEPLFIIKFSIILFVLGMIVQYALLILSKKKGNEEDEEEEEEQIHKNAKKDKKDLKEKKAKQSKKKDASREKKKKRKKKQEKKKYDLEAEFFLVEIFSNIAQSIKDFVVNRYEDDYEDEEDLDEDYEDEEDEEFDVEEEVFDEEEEEEEIKKEPIIKKDLKRVIFNQEKVDILENNRKVANDKKVETTPKIQIEPIIQINEIQPSLKEEQSSIQTEFYEDSDSINSFDLDDIEHMLEQELEHSLEKEKEKELEDLIIKETFKTLN